MSNVLLINDSPPGRRGLTNPRTVERVALEVEPHDGFAHYLRTKREKIGHLIHPARWGRVLTLAVVRC